LTAVWIAAALAAGSSNWITIGSEHGRYWLERDGSPFWSFGVDCVDTGVEPAKFSAANPAYCGLRLFPSEQAWASNALAQLRSWGFNTLGAWSDAETFQKWGGAARLPYAVCLHLGSYDQAPWHDMFAAQMERAIDGAAASQIPKFRDDSLLIGYFSDNELGWWDDTLFSSYLHMPAASPGRKALNAQMRTTYHGSLAALREDWITDAGSFEQIREMKLRAGRGGRRLVKDWAYTLGTRYYKLVHDAIRRYDAHHLILGDRYCQFYSLPIVKASAPFVDVVSTNLGADWNDGTLSPFFLSTLHRATGKPVMVSEFYMAAMENRSGDKNSSDGFPVVRTQKERAAAFGRYVREVASLPYTVGAHWFQYSDEPGNGRGDGENYNMGLVDTLGRPYEEITAEAAACRPEAVHREGPLAALSPKGRGFPDANLGPHPALSPEGRGFPDANLGPHPALSPEGRGFPEADLYGFRDGSGVYLGLYSMDYTDKSLYPGNTVPEVDRARLSISLPGGRAVSIRFGADRAPVLSGCPGGRVKESGGLKSTLLVFIPKSLVRPGAFDVVYTSHGRTESAEWRFKP
jgi:hypothetical protein